MLSQVKRITHIVALTTLIAACGGGTSTNELVAQAKQHLQQGKISEATIQLKNALKQDPQFASARLVLSDIYLEQGAWLDAIKELEKAQRGETPLPDDYQLKLAKAYFFSGDSKALTRMAEARSSLDNEHKLVIYAYTALSLLQNNQTDAGNSYLQRAQEISQSATFSHLGKAYQQALSDDYAQALSTVTAVLQQNPELDAALTLKASLLSAQGRYAEAADSFKAFLDKHPRAYQQRLLYASALTAADAFDDAKKEVEALLTISPNHPFVNELHAEIFYQERQFEQAKIAAEKALKGGVGSIKNHLIAGISALNLGQQEQAYRHIRQVEQHQPDHPQLKRILAELKLKLGYVDEVAEMLSSMSPDTQKDALLYSNTSIALAKQGKTEQAEQYAAIAEDLAPDNSQILLQRGQLKLVSNEAGAVDDILKALDANPENSEALVTLVRNHINQQQYQQAHDALEAATQAAPALRQWLKGDIYRAQKQIADARKAYTQSLKLDPSNLNVQVNLAILDELDGNPQRALQQYRTLLADHPGHGGLIRLLVNLYRQQPSLQPDIKAVFEQQQGSHPLTALTLSAIQQQTDELDSAVQTIQTALQKYPAQKRLLNRLGDLQLQKKAYADAVASYQKSLQIDGNQPKIWLKNIAGLEAQNLINSALSELQRARQETNSTAILDLTEASLYLSEGQLDKAEQILEQFKQTQPDVVGYHLLASRLAEKQGNTSQLVHHREAVFRTYSNLSTGTSLLKAYMAAQNYSKAWALIKEVEQHAPNNEGLKLAKGDVLLRTDPKAAQAYYEGLINQPPVNPVILNNLAHIYLNNPTRTADAVKLSQQALAVLPNHPAIQETLAHAHLVNGQPQQALAIYNKLAPAVRNTPDVQLRYIQTLIETGQAAQAKQQLKQLEHASLNTEQQQQLSKVKQMLGAS